MNKKEKQLIETIKDYLSEGEEYRAKKFIFENDKYIYCDERCEQFNFEFNKLELEIDWTPHRYESDYEYNRQMDRVSDDPWK
jgi:hypothetical protein